MNFRTSLINQLFASKFELEMSVDMLINSDAPLDISNDSKEKLLHIAISITVCWLICIIQHGKYVRSVYIHVQVMLDIIYNVNFLQL